MAVPVGPEDDRPSGVTFVVVDGASDAIDDRDVGSSYAGVGRQGVHRSDDGGGDLDRAVDDRVGCRSMPSSMRTGDST